MARKIVLLLFIFSSLHLFSESKSVSATPTVAAPIPTEDTVNVISIYSDKYPGYANTDLNLTWNNQNAVATFIELAQGDSVMKIENLDFKPIQFSPVINASEMTHLHVDIWCEVDISNISIGITTWNGPTVTKNVMLPKLIKNQWNSVNIPLTQYIAQGAAFSHMGILRINGKSQTIYVDNLYLYKDPTVPTEPVEAAPAPFQYPVSNVKSIFSDSFNNIITSIANWGQNTQPITYQIDGNNTLKLENFNFYPLDLNNADMSEMDSIHFDVWSMNCPSFSLTLNGGGREITKAVNNLALGTWNKVEIALTEFANDTMYVPMDTLNFLMLKDGNGGTIYLDNLFFYKHGEGTPIEPQTAAPTPPERERTSVKSVYSDAYTNIGSKTATWGQSTVVSTFVVDNDNMLRYDYFNFLPTDLTEQNVGSMEYLHFDIWTINEKSIILNLNGGSVEADSLITGIVKGEWNSFDIPISYFSNKGVNLNKLNYLLFKGGKGGTIFLDNTYFYTDGPVIPTLPQLAAPLPPARNNNDVISLFSDVYTNIPWNEANWGQNTNSSNIQIAEDNTLLYENFNFLPMNLDEIDVSNMESLHVDIWTSDTNPLTISLNGGSGSESDHFIENINLGYWNSFDISLSDFDGVALDKLHYLAFKNGTGGTLYVDNIYFHKTASSSVEQTDNKIFSIYPNPASDIIRIESSHNISNVTIKNMLGQTVSQNTTENIKEIDITNLAAGNYLIIVKFEDNTSYSQKLLKSK